MLSGRVLESDEVPPPWSGVRLATVRRRYSTLMTCARALLGQGVARFSPVSYSCDCDNTIVQMTRTSVSATQAIISGTANKNRYTRTHIGCDWVTGGRERFFAMCVARWLALAPRLSSEHRCYRACEAPAVSSPEVNGVMSGVASGESAV